MHNPFRSEAAAFRLVLLLVGYFAAIVLAKALFGTVAALVVFVVLTVAAVVYAVRTGRQERPPPAASPRRGAEDERRILVIANETVGGAALRECIHEKSEGYRESVLVVMPALNSHLRHWTSDEDGARAAASQRLERSLARLHELGVDASGEVGDSDPLQALEDYARHLRAGRDHHLDASRRAARTGSSAASSREARERFAVPITHVVVDLEAEREEVR